MHPVVRRYAHPGAGPGHDPTGNTPEPTPPLVDQRLPLRGRHGHTGHSTRDGPGNQPTTHGRMAASSPFIGISQPFTDPATRPRTVKRRKYRADRR